MIEEICDTLYEAVNWGLSEIRWFKRAEGEQAEKMKATAARQTAELQGWLVDRLGDAQWFNGASFGWADLSVAPHVNRSFHYGFGTPPGSALDKWRDRIRERPSVAKTFREFEAASERMGDAAARLASGAIRREYRDHRLEWMMKSGGVQIVLDGLARNNIRFTWPLG
jgi:glutathione S-transferase